SRSPSTAGSLRPATNQCQARSTVYLTVPNELVLRVEFDTGLFGESRVRKVVERFQRVLEAMTGEVR
ncbi:hypothetical protein, partial [Mycobacteroides abscessus]|uniref:hypothetical protein n=1 Tax=Mycobacteroides abscessus TaxID=36809 RepID=UPI001A9627E6